MFQKVGALYLFRKSIQSGVNAYGKRKWHDLVRDIALGLLPVKKLRQVSQVVGQPLKPVYQVQGISMQGREFGLEFFHGGQFLPMTFMEGGGRDIQVAGLMRQCCRGDMLGVFSAQREGALNFRWDDVDEVNPEEVALVYDDVSELLGRKRSCEIALDMTWKGRNGKCRGMDSAQKFLGHKHAFHMTK